MGLYTVLLVDDEEEVIQVIMKKIVWENLGFSIIGYATNGMKALEMVEEHQPDVVMADIRMPYMDGIELARRIKENYSATRILLLTGFDEFEYAKEAVHLKVEEYLLKPVDSKVLTQVFTQLKERMDQDREEKRSAQVLQQYYMESLPFLQANFFTTLVEGRVPSEELPKYLSDCQIQMPGPCYCCLLIHTSRSRTPSDMSPLLLSTSVQRQAREYLGEKWNAECFTYLGNTVLLAQFDGEARITELTDDCERFCRYANRTIGAVVTVGVGQVCRELLELAASYSSAREAVSYRVLYGSGGAINMKEIAPQESDQEEQVQDTRLFSLLKAIRLGSEEDVTAAAEEYIRHIRESAGSLQNYDIKIMELTMELCRFTANNGIDAAAVLGDTRSLQSRLLDMEPQELHSWLEETSQELRGELVRGRQQSSRSFVVHAKEYIAEHYADAELSLDTICEELGVSNAYFSTIFKKEAGMSFIAYLTDYRMERAARQLIETDEKSYVIAGNVGYADPNYFSYVFKRHFGVSPSKYRTEHT